MLAATPENLLAGAAEALAIGQRIGRKVILLSTSTGGTLSMLLAAQHPEAVHAQLLYSPNFDMVNPATDLLDEPWGLEIARAVYGSESRSVPHENTSCHQYWTVNQRLEALVHLQALVDEGMTAETYQAVKQPLFLGYYYKNEAQQDDQVKVSTMLDMFGQVSTSAADKQQVAFPDAGAHVIGCDMKSADVAGVQAATFAFAERVLGLHPQPAASDSTANR